MLLATKPTRAATKTEIDAGVRASLAQLRATPQVDPLLRRAVAQLIFPSILSGGLIVGGQFGEGALVRNNAIDSYYQIRGLSVGLLAGAQTAGLAMLFMQEDALAALRRSDGWQIGTGPSVVAFDVGAQFNATSTTVGQPVYAITFGQQGLMASLSLEGSRITPFTPTA